MFSSDTQEGDRRSVSTSTSLVSQTVNHDTGLIQGRYVRFEVLQGPIYHGVLAYYEVNASRNKCVLNREYEIWPTMDCRCET